MKKFLSALGFLCLLFSGLCCTTHQVPRGYQQKKTRLLVFSKTEAVRHQSIPDAVALFKEFGDTEPDFTVTTTEDASKFNAPYLKPFGAVVFLNTSGNVLNESQQQALKAFIRGGGGFMGVHAAAETELNWPWYGKMLGAYATDHSTVQEATLYVLQNSHPATQFLPGVWTRTDAWYNFRDIQDDITPLINLDESTYQGGENGANHPIAWFHTFEGGRVFYTGGGHTTASFHDSFFTRHLLGGIKYVLDITP